MSTRLILLSHVSDGDGDLFLNRPGTVTFRYAGAEPLPASTGGPPGPDVGTFAEPYFTAVSVSSVPVRPGATKPFVATVRTTGVRENEDSIADDPDAPGVPVTLVMTASIA